MMKLGVQQGVVSTHTLPYILHIPDVLEGIFVQTFPAAQLIPLGKAAHQYLVFVCGGFAGVFMA